MLGIGRDYTREGETLLKGLHADETALEAAEEWGRGVLARSGLDARTQSVQAIRALRSADRRLSLIAAKVLVDRLNGRRAPRQGRKPGPPPATLR
ncbi:hypothetical protein Bequi_08785 [Brachybacterium sp. JHP9]|uniref:ANTAR domain-containing protein n=1 Tax=Brachybacterium equifaecis TaxID=2910770 RepID=A0ABT0R0P7_9MICO|nr:hypothetical protein [Brachybacterium equifaecis]MCL6423482.1 hypothetical protein [Brachybacterium equifaecis]